MRGLRVGGFGGGHGSCDCRMQEPWLGKVWGTQELLPGGLGDAGAAAEEDLEDVGAVAGEMCRTQEPWPGRCVGCGICGRGGCGGCQSCSRGGFSGCRSCGVGGCMGPGPGGSAGPGPRLTRVCAQVGWTRVNLAKKLLEKTSGVTLVLKKIPLDLPGSPPSPRQQVSAPSTAPVLHGAVPGTRQGCSELGISHHVGGP